LLSLRSSVSNSVKLHNDFGILPIVIIVIVIVYDVLARITLMLRSTVLTVEQISLQVQRSQL
jgi:hypothetical protein